MKIIIDVEWLLPLWIPTVLDCLSPAQLTPLSSQTSLNVYDKYEYEYDEYDCEYKYEYDEYECEYEYEYEAHGAAVLSKSYYLGVDNTQRIRVRKLVQSSETTEIYHHTIINNLQYTGYWHFKWTENKSGKLAFEPFTLSEIPWL